jgi:hypothetical protein
MGAVMRIRLILAAAATLALAACAESPSAPSSLQPGARTDDVTCRSGYHVATRIDGTEVCESDAPMAATTAP